MPSTKNSHQTTGEHPLTAILKVLAEIESRRALCGVKNTNGTLRISPRRGR